MSLRSIRIHLTAVDPIRLRAMEEVVAGAPGLRLLGTSELGPQVAERAIRTHVRVVVVLAGAVPLTALHVVGSLRGLQPRVESLVLVEEPVRADRVQALLAAGARGLLAERIDGPELERAVTSVARGGCVLSPSAADVVLERAGEAQRLHLGVPLESLDIEVLALLATGLSAHQAAAKLGVDDVTVRSSVRCAKRAFGQRTQEGVVAAAIRRGLI